MSFRIITAVAIAAALIGSAVAFAAQPAKDSSFAWCTGKNMCPMTFNTNKKGTKIVNMSLYTKCAAVPMADGYWPNMRVNDKGKFKRSGTAVDVIGQAIDFTIKGRFKKPGKAVGTYQVERKGCNDGEHEFVAKRQGAVG